jgi:hypothetical protein
MKKYFVPASIALAIMFSCSKENNNTDMDSLRSEGSNLSSQNGDLPARTSDSFSRIVFYSSSKEDGIFFINNCLPTGRILLKNGSFNGNLKGFGTIRSNLSPYEFVQPCDVLQDVSPYENFYSVVMVGKVALSSKDYCKITIRGNISLGYNTSLVKPSLNQVLAN